MLAEPPTRNAAMSVSGTPATAFSRSTRNSSVTRAPGGSTSPGSRSRVTTTPEIGASITERSRRRRACSAWASAACSAEVAAISSWRVTCSRLKSWSVFS